MQSRPNILCILTDQHRAMSACCYGRTDARTPGIGKLAERSVLFSRAYCQYPICTASRQSILTGQYPGRHGTYQNIAQSIDPWQWTFPGAFSRAGYETALIGKAHCNKNGFLYQLEHEEMARKYWPKQILEEINPPFHGLDYRLNAATVGPWPWDEKFQMSDWVMRETIRFLQTPRPRPFLAFVSFEHPHPPFLVPQRYLDLFDPDAFELAPRDPNFPANPHWGEELLTEAMQRKYLHGYYAALAYADECIGKIITAAEDAGLLGNTIVLYTSDHGESGGHHNKYEKHDFFEPDIHVPLLIRVPGTAPRRVDELVELVDIAPTLLDLCGIRDDQPARFDGAPLVNLMQGQAAGWKNRVICENYWPERTLRNGEHRKEEYGRMIRRGSIKCCLGGNMPYPASLFDLGKDPHEFHNLWQDPDYRGIRDELLRELHTDWIKLETPGKSRLFQG